MSDVHWDGSVTGSADRPKIMRWLARFALALVVAGVALQVGGNALWSGLLIMPAFVISTVMLVKVYYFAPVRVNARGQRRRGRQMRAGLQSFLAVGSLALVGLPVLSISSGLGGWTPASHDDWQILMFALLTVFFVAPMAFPRFATRMLEGID